MFDRFTDRAKKVLSFSRQHALRLNHEYIAPEHMLLGIVEEGTGVAANVLKNMSVDFAAVRREVERLVAPGRSKVTMGQLPFTVSAKRVLEAALEQASEFGHNYIGTEHLLLGLLREHTSLAAEALRNLGVELQAVREEVLEFLGVEEPDAERGAAGRAVHGVGDAGALQRSVLDAVRRARKRVQGSVYVVLPRLERDANERDDRLSALYRDVIRPALRDAGASDVRSNRDPQPAEVASLADRLSGASVLIVVVAGGDPDVHFALGFALGLFCEPIVLAARAEDLPAELRSAPFLPLAFDGVGLAALREQLTTHVRHRIEQQGGDRPDGG